MRWVLLCGVVLAGVLVGEQRPGSAAVGAPPPPALYVDDPVVVEGPPGSTVPAVFTLSLSAAPAAGKTVSVQVATADGSAKVAKGDYRAVPATVVPFASGERTKTVRVDVLGDARVEAGETLRLILSKPVGATLGDTQGLATILDGGGSPSVAFRDVTLEAGLGALSSAYSHAAAWGDANGDGRVDLYVGTFADSKRKDGQTPSPNRLFLGTGSGFVPADQPGVETRGRTSGSVLADLDDDADLDLVVANNRKPSATATPELLEPTRLFRNDAGMFVDVTAASGIGVADRNSRAVGVLDYDGDGRLDLFVVADSLTGSGVRVSRLLRNLGGLTFADATGAAGLPTNHAGLGVAVGDANGDGWPDLVTTGGVSASGSYARAFLFVNDGAGRFRDATTPALAWTARGNEDWTAGADFGDLNRDGRLDLIVTHHFDSARTQPIAPRAYLNVGNAPDGTPLFDELIDVGLAPIATKAPHVEIVDVDNDGLPDLLVSVLLDTERGPAPYVYLQRPSATGRPVFQAPTGTVRSYAPGGPTADYDGDGRLDVFLEGLGVDVAPSLLQNVSPSGHWLAVRVAQAGSNHLGTGARVTVYRSGKLGRPNAVLGVADIGTGNGFSSASPLEARFGLGAVTTVDVAVKLPFGGPTLTARAVPVDRVVTLG